MQEDKLEIEASKPEKEGHPNSSLGRITVLIADDEKVIREIVKMVLEQAGYKVITAVDGEDAINKFIEHQDNIQFLLFDVMMPNKNGKEAYTAIRKIRPAIKTLFMSGYSAELLTKEGVLNKDLNIISKPFFPSELLREIGNIIGKPQTHTV